MIIPATSDFNARRTDDLGPVEWRSLRRRAARARVCEAKTMINDTCLGVAVHAARRAASVVVDAARDLRRRPSHARDRGDVASNASAEAENAIIATLRAAYPNHAIVGREAGEIVSEIRHDSRRGNRAPEWVVDPIDGMLNFRRGYPYYAVSIALVDNGEVTHAAVLDPFHDDLFTAVKGKGAEHNGAPIRPSACIRLEEALVGAALPRRGSGKIASYLAVENSLVAHCAGLRRAGAIALDLAYVAAGRLDGLFVMTEHAWEFSAGVLIVDEASGSVSDFAGGNDFRRTNELIAAAPGIFNSLRGAIAAASRPR